MARYELGAIYKIAGGEKTYYARLLTDDVYGIFEPIFEEICQKTFENAAYRLYISTGSFAVKRGFWEKILSSPDKTDVERWNRDRKSTRLNSSHANISYAVFCLKKKKKMS